VIKDTAFNNDVSDFLLDQYIEAMNEEVTGFSFIQVEKTVTVNGEWYANCNDDKKDVFTSMTEALGAPQTDVMDVYFCQVPIRLGFVPVLPTIPSSPRSIQTEWRFSRIALFLPRGIYLFMRLATGFRWRIAFLILIKEGMAHVLKKRESTIRLTAPSHSSVMAWMTRLYTF